MKVLIVDDEDIICEWLQFCISQNPVCQLAGVAHNGREALEVFRASQPDLVLTDIKMPVMDGLELLHAIRATGSAAKVVVLTAFAEFDMARQALREGADEYLLKTEMQNDALQQLLGRMSRQYNLQGGAGLVGSAQAHAIIRKVLRRQGELSEEDLAELRRCGVRWRDNGLFALAVWKQDLMGAGLTFPQEGPAHHVAGFDYTDRIYVVVGNLPRALSENEKARQLTQYAQQTQRMNDCMVGISATTDQMRQIPSLARQAAFSLAQGFYTGKKRLYEPQKPLPALQEQVRGWKAQVSARRLGLYQQRPAQRCESLQAFLDETARDRMPAVELVTKFCTELFEQFYLEAKEAGIALPPPGRSAGAAGPKHLDARDHGPGNGFCPPVRAGSAAGKAPFQSGESGGGIHPPPFCRDHQPGTGGRRGLPEPGIFFPGVQRGDGGHFREFFDRAAPEALGAAAGEHGPARAGCGPAGGLPQCELFFHHL